MQSRVFSGCVSFQTFTVSLHGGNFDRTSRLDGDDMRAIDSDFWEEVGVGCMTWRERTVGRVSLESRLDLCRLQHQPPLPLGNYINILEPSTELCCDFFCFPDEPNRSFSFEGIFILNYTCISISILVKLFLALSRACTRLYNPQKAKSCKFASYVWILTS